MLILLLITYGMAIPAHMEAAYDVPIVSSNNLLSLSNGLYRCRFQVMHLWRDCLSYHFIPSNEKGTGSVAIAIQRS